MKKNNFWKIFGGCFGSLILAGLVIVLIGATYVYASPAVSLATIVDRVRPGGTPLFGSSRAIEPQQVKILPGSSNSVANVPNTGTVTRTEQQSGGPETYDYIPGGEGTGMWANDVSLTPNQLGTSDFASVADGDCGRFYQATNLEFLTWIAVYCDFVTTEGTAYQLTHAYEFTFSGGSISFDLFRDLEASAMIAPDPYITANLKNSPLGLGVFFQGNGEVCVNSDCLPLDGTGVYQLAFPADWAGSYSIEITVPAGQTLHMWFGERLTTEDTWPLPNANGAK